MLNPLLSYTDSRQRLKLKGNGFSLEFCVRFKSLLPLEGLSSNFGKMFILVRQCAEPIAQPRILSYRSLDLALILSPLHAHLEGFQINIGQMLISVKPCAELMNQLCRHKVKDKLKGLGV